MNIISLNHEDPFMILLHPMSVTSFADFKFKLLNHTGCLHEKNISQCQKKSQMLPVRFQVKWIISV